MTAQMPMAAHQRMASLSDLLPHDRSPREGWRAFLPRFSWRRPQGLASIPERYRLQFLLLADAAMPGQTEPEVAAMADALADRTRPPKRLLARTQDTTGLDGWFRDHADQIKESLADLLEAETR